VLYLFDIDGTLLLSGGAGARALERAFAARYGLEGAMAEVQLGGKTDPNIVEEVFVARLGRRPVDSEVAEILELYVPLLRAELAAATHFRLMPAVEETLDHLAGQGGVRIGLGHRQHPGRRPGQARARRPVEPVRARRLRLRSPRTASPGRAAPSSGPAR
jgi:phosphoglycolate phosphatase-like HAD superfamily hydrolase